MAKNVTVWSNNTKPAAPWTPTTKDTANWQEVETVEVPYLYDDPTVTYDDPTRSYDYLNPQTNQLNRTNPTAWSND